MRKLSDGDRARIQAAVTAAEARTRARIACVVIPASDRYSLYPLLAGALAAFLLGAVMALLLRRLSFRIGVEVEVLAFVVIAFFVDWLPIRLAMVPSAVKRGHARTFAHREFAARILAPSDRREGILLFVSLAERYVEVIATQDVHAKVGGAQWNAIVDDFVRTARAGNVADGAVAAITACADHLTTHFPG